MLPVGPNYISRYETKTSGMNKKKVEGINSRLNHRRIKLVRLKAEHQKQSKFKNCI